MNKQWFSVFSAIATLFVTVYSQEFQQDISFVFYNQDYVPSFRTNSLQHKIASTSSCRPNDAVTFIVHGYNENCEAAWVSLLVKNYMDFRGGCVVCMDYRNFSVNINYFALVAQFNGISTVLTNKLRHFESEGFSGDLISMFGFSFGGQLVLNSGREFGVGCDPAGPAFYLNSTYSALDPRAAAKNVQCIHTSVDRGTLLHNCDQDWIMGMCGMYQVAAGNKLFGSHRLCPYLFSSSFVNKFVAIAKSSECTFSSRDAKVWPPGFKMGATETRKRMVQGFNFYAETSKFYPYNVISR